MSNGALEQSRSTRKLCNRCRERKARFLYRGRVKADRDHTLCFECFRAERDHRRAQMLAEVSRPLPLRSPFDAAPALTPREVAHRQRMLRHLASGGGAAVQPLLFAETAETGTAGRGTM